MTDFVTTYLRRRARLTEAGAYDPSSEHDACGVGLVAALDAEPRREIVDMAIAALKAFNDWRLSG